MSECRFYLSFCNEFRFLKSDFYFLNLFRFHSDKLPYPRPEANENISEGYMSMFFVFAMLRRCSSFSVITEVVRWVRSHRPR